MGITAHPPADRPTLQGFEDSIFSLDPWGIFKAWMGEAEKHQQIAEANAVNLATVSASGKPRNRMVLVKDFNIKGLVFYTNLHSQKGADLTENPYAAMCFYWEVLGKQIRVEGQVQQIDDQTADQYFTSRPRKSQIGAWASRQSQPIENISVLLRNIAHRTKKFGIGPIPRPSFWTGFCLIPDSFEFWERGAFRLHKRNKYIRQPNQSWKHVMLSP